MIDYLADTSAWIVSRRVGSLRQRYADLLDLDRIGTCHPVMMELLYSTRNATEFELRRAGLEVLPRAPIDTSTWGRAIDVAALLARKGGMHHRQVGHLDLVIAAAAEQAGVTLLHYDQHFDVIAAVTGQPTEWIAPRGSI